MKAIISDTSAVMKKRPTKPFHMMSRDRMVATANTSPTMAPLSEFTAGTPTTNCLPS